MSRAARARRLVKAAAYGGGGLGAAGAAGAGILYGLIAAQSRLARRRIPIPTTAPPATDGSTWAADGVSLSRPPIRVALLGDSTAAGYGVHRARDTPGVRVAIGVSTVARRPVQLSNVAVIGAESRELPEQLQRLRGDFDVALILVGANDVTARSKPADAVRHLRAAVEALIGAGIEVVVGTCPDLGTIRPLAQPLRFLARRLSRTLAAAQTIAVVEAGGRTVSLGDILGHLFATNVEMFSEDRFHPSAAGYGAAADTLLPSVLDALGLGTRSRAATTFGTRRARPVARAAAKAAANPGTEVTPTETAGRFHLTGNVLVRLRRRRPPALVQSSPESATRL